jgi:hypothetical protein
MLKKWSSSWRNSRNPLKCICGWGSTSNHVASKRRASSTRELEKKGGLVGFHLRGNGNAFWGWNSSPIIMCS